MISGAQIREARKLLGWSGYMLAFKAGGGVNQAALIRAEAADGKPAILEFQARAIQRAFEAAGVIFVDENGEGPGVRLRKAGV